MKTGGWLTADIFDKTGIAVFYGGKKEIGACGPGHEDKMNYLSTPISGVEYERTHVININGFNCSAIEWSYRVLYDLLESRSKLA